MPVDRPPDGTSRPGLLAGRRTTQPTKDPPTSPATAGEFYREEMSSLGGKKPSSSSSSSSLLGWNDRVVLTVLAGTRSRFTSTPSSPLSLLLEHEDTLVRQILAMVPYPYYVDNHIRLTIPAPMVGTLARSGSRMRFTHGRGSSNYGRRDIVPHVPRVSKGHNQKDAFVAFARCGRVEFPPPTNDRAVTMMPFILGDISSLPADLQPYYPMIEACPFLREELGRVAYLTIQERYVDVDADDDDTDQESQQQHLLGGRRGGLLHVEPPGLFSDDTPRVASFEPASEQPWGNCIHYGPDKYEGGIYFASNRGDTSKVWDALVDSTVQGIVDAGGKCEHVRDWIGEGTTLEANELIWMTDRTPHEALPQARSSGHYQFFRLVMPYIKHWYADQYTANPNVQLPAHIKVIHSGN